MDAWSVIVRAAADRRSGAADVALRVLPALGALDGAREVVRAARKLLRAHAAMAPVWHACAAALDGPRAIEALSARLSSEPRAIASATAGWALPRRAATVLTHSWSSTVVAALHRAGSRRVRVVCTSSLPGGEGRLLAARLRRDGFDARVAHDSTVIREAAEAAVVLVGGDAVTGDAVVNKVGTYACALAAREAGIPCYVLAGSTKLLPDGAWRPERAAAFEATPLALFDAVITERGPQRPPAIRRAASRVVIPDRLLALV